MLYWNRLKKACVVNIYKKVYVIFLLIACNTKNIDIISIFNTCIVDQTIYSAGIELFHTAITTDI